MHGWGRLASQKARDLTAMTISPLTAQTLNDADYQRHKVPEDLATFGTLQTEAGALPLVSMDLEGEIVACCATSSCASASSTPTRSRSRPPTSSRCPAGRPSAHS